MLVLAILVLGLVLGILLTVASKRDRPGRRGGGTVVAPPEVDDDNPTGLGPGYSWQDVGAYQAEQDRLEPGGGDFGGGGASAGWDSPGNGASDGDGGD